MGLVEEHLDKFLSNCTWHDLGLCSTVTHFDSWWANHSPILLKIASTKGSRKIEG